MKSQHFNRQVQTKSFDCVCLCVRVFTGATANKKNMRANIIIPLYCFGCFIHIEDLIVAIEGMSRTTSDRGNLFGAFKESYGEVGPMDIPGIGKYSSMGMVSTVLSSYKLNLLLHLTIQGVHRKDTHALTIPIPTFGWPSS